MNSRLTLKRLSTTSRTAHLEWLGRFNIHADWLCLWFASVLFSWLFWLVYTLKFLWETYAIHADVMTWSPTMLGCLYLCAWLQKWNWRQVNEDYFRCNSVGGSLMRVSQFVNHYLKFNVHLVKGCLSARSLTIRPEKNSKIMFYSWPTHTIFCLRP